MSGRKVPGGERCVSQKRGVTQKLINVDGEGVCFCQNDVDLGSRYTLSSRIKSALNQ